MQNPFPESFQIIFLKKTKQKNLLPLPNLVEDLKARNDTVHVFSFSILLMLLQ